MTQTKLTKREHDDALLNAAKNGDLDALKKAHSQGANIHVADDFAVRWAAEYGHLDIVRYLVEEYKADTHAGDDYAVRWAAGNGHLKVVRYLVEEHKADIHAQDDFAVRLAASNGHLDVVRYLVEEHDANIHAQNDYAVCWAAYNGHLKVVRYLVEEHKADIHAQDDYAVCWAAYNGHLEVLRYLIEKGANYKIIIGECFTSKPDSWPEDKLKDLFVLNFIYSHPAAAVHFWSVLPNERKTVSLRQHFRMNYFLALQNVRKKPRRIAQTQQRKMSVSL